MLYHRCIECETEINPDNYNEGEFICECGSEDYEEVYRLRCVECGETFEGGFNDPCIDCDGDTEEII